MCSRWERSGRGGLLGGMITVALSYDIPYRLRRRSPVWKKPDGGLKSGHEGTAPFFTNGPRAGPRAEGRGPALGPRPSALGPGPHKSVVSVGLVSDNLLPTNLDLPPPLRAPSPPPLSLAQPLYRGPRSRTTCRRVRRTPSSCPPSWCSSLGGEGCAPHELRGSALLLFDFEGQTMIDQMRPKNSNHEPSNHPTNRPPAGCLVVLDNGALEDSGGPAAQLSRSRRSN